MFTVNTTNITSITDVTSYLSLTTFPRLILISFNILIICLGLVGNGVVLCAAILHNILQMDRISLLLVQSLAYTDMLIILFNYVPSLLTLVTQRWVLGASMCFIIASLKQAPYINEILILVALSVYRLWMLRKPPGMRNVFSDLRAHTLIALLWCVSIAVIVGFIAADVYAFYDPAALNCRSSNFYEARLLYVNLAVLVLLVIVPLFIIISTNIAIIYLAVRSTIKTGQGGQGLLGHGLKQHRTAVIALSCVCWGFIISYIPYFSVKMLSIAGGHVPLWLDLLKLYVTSISASVNPCIYFVTNHKFRKYVKNSLKMRHVGSQLQASKAGSQLQASKSVKVVKAVQAVQDDV